MSIFEPITLNWNDREYTIPSNRVMGAIRKIEDVVTLDQLAKYAEQEAAPLAKVASAYGAVLRYAGCHVTDEDVYALMYDEAQSTVVLMTAVQGILAMMLPRNQRDKLASVMSGDSPLPEISEEELRKTEGKSGGGGQSALSTKRTKYRSGKSGSRRKNSGRSTRKNFGF